MNNSKILMFLGLAAMTACSPAEQSVEQVAEQEPATEMRISGNISGISTDGEFMVSLSSAGLGGTDELATVPIVDGEVDLSFIPGETEVAWISAQNADGDYVGKGFIVLEPGTFTIEQGGASERLKVRGSGPLNNELFYSWRQEAGYKKLSDEYERAVEGLNALPEGEERGSYYTSTFEPAYKEFKAYEGDVMAAFALDDSKPLLARMATMNGGLRGGEALARLDELEEILGESEVVDRYRARMDAHKQMANIARNFGVGETAVDFTLPTLDGEQLSLSEVLAENEFVLLEFWAVWCAPCRAEIPHMKRAYAEYSDKGFEIVSVSLDNNREDWEILSEEENIPWFNTSDLMAYSSPVIQQYGVLGIPKNYLVNSDFEIVAMDLRQELLDEALAERLGSH